MDLFNIETEEDFNKQALLVFNYQYKHNVVYRDFCKAIGKLPPKHYTEIPFLPISFFKSHRLLSDEIKETDLLTFKSSGTTLGTRSKHVVAQPVVYEYSFYKTFLNQLGNPEEAIILALLPNYLEQGDSSLIYMVDFLIKATKHPLSGFYLDDVAHLVHTIEEAKKEDKTVILFGVSYALLDFAQEKVDLSGVKIIETGGMKGRRKEMIKEELHATLRKGLNVEHIYSEYGMTELLSQAYTDGTEYFKTPNWMKILIRDVNDPLTYIEENRTGGVNVIDLANYYSCSFIATDDLGSIHNHRFKILGRFDQSDIRGCNLLVN